MFIFLIFRKRTKHHVYLIPFTYKPFVFVQIHISVRDFSELNVKNQHESSLMMKNTRT